MATLGIDVHSDGYQPAILGSSALLVQVASLNGVVALAVPVTLRSARAGEAGHIRHVHTSPFQKFSWLIWPSTDDGKAMLAAVQARTVLAQAATWSQRRRCCPACGEQRRSKGSYPLVFRTLYGDVGLDSLRLHRCPC